MRVDWKSAALWAALAAGSVPSARAIPPLVSGDVPTAEKGHAEVYLGFKTEEDGGIARELPADEVVLGVSSRQEITVEAPRASLTPASGGGRSGPGDVTLGTKLMFLREAAGRPGASVSVEGKLDNGDAAKGLGSGAVDYGVLLRVQKSWSWFTGIANAGYSFVGSPTIDGMRQDRRDVRFFSLAQAYRVGARTSLLSELYWQNSDVPGEPSRLAGNVGFMHDVRGWLQVHASAGKSLRDGNLGGPRLRAYAGIKLEFAVFGSER